MHPTFILTRAFAISALFVGAPLAYAAPMAEVRAPATAEAVVGLLTRDIPIEVRAPIDVDIVERGTEIPVGARSAEADAHKLVGRVCLADRCRRERD
ncbi:hypothetical protein BC835DRAFT_2947 [Cytidiella melzeri]|nr:hypothetical protein BC835DRAFT_2947 [Cytidiella melzeri]